jgi:hypothetical protein
VLIEQYPVVAQRHAVDGDKLIVFGDERLADLQDGDRVSATINGG